MCRELGKLSCRATFSEPYLYRYLLPGYRDFEPLYRIPFSRIRISDIVELTKGHTQRIKDRTFLVYKILDGFAYQRRIIPFRYASNIKIPERPRKELLTMDESDVQKLKEHQGELAVDIVLTFLYTGIKLQEFLSLKHEDFNHGILTVNNAQHQYPTRYIPVHHSMHSSLTSSISYALQLQEKQYSFQYKKKLVQVLVKETTLHYLSFPFTPESCRITFDNRLLNASVPRCAIDQLRGTRGTYSSTYEEIYRHLSIDSLRSYIERCA